MNQNRENLAEVIMRLARRIRHSSSDDYHINRLDRLRLLLLAHDAIGLRELAQLMDMRPPSVSEWLDKLLESGEINKVRDEEDKRAVRISLTDKGYQLAKAAKEKAKEPLDIFAGCLPAEQEKMFIATCRQLHEHLGRYADQSEARHHHHGYRHDSSRRQGRRQQMTDPNVETANERSATGRERLHG